MPKLSIFQTVLLAVFGALAVAGVLIFALFVGGGGSKTVGPVTIWGTFPEAVFNEILQQISDTDDSFAQVSYVQRNADSYITGLTEALAAGSGPDIYILQEGQALRDGGKITPVPYSYISATDFQNNFIEAANPFLGASGITAIPLIADPLVLYWNRDLLAAEGYPNPPQYWGDIKNGMVQKITKKTDEGEILKSTVSFGEYRNVTNAKSIISMLIMQAGSPITATDDSGRLVSALSAENSGQATEYALLFYTEFANPSKAVYSWNRALSDSRSAFIAGDLALYIGFASEVEQIKRMNPNLNFGVAAVPQISEKERPIDVARVYGLAITRTSKNPLGALHVAARLTSKDTSYSLSVALKMPSARRDVLGSNNPNDDDLFNRQAIISRAWSDPNPIATDGIFRTMIESITSGALRLSEAIERADQELEQLLTI